MLTEIMKNELVEGLQNLLHEEIIKHGGTGTFVPWQSAQLKD